MRGGSAVAAYLAQYKFNLKTSPSSKFKANAVNQTTENLVFEEYKSQSDSTQKDTSKEWDNGTIYARAQNMARTVCIPSLRAMRMLITFL